VVGQIGRTKILSSIDAEE